MQIEEVNVLISELLTREKKQDLKEKYGETYVDAVRQKKRIKAHADPNYFPEDLFKVRAPNATKEQYDYVKGNYKATTNPVWRDFLTVIDKAFIDNNWSIEWPDNSEDLRKYLDEDLPTFKSIEYFVKSVLPNIKLSDPMGVLAVRPKGFNFVENEEGEMILEDREFIEPAIYYHPSEKVLLRDHDSFLVVDDSKSMVEFGGKMVKDGRILFLYTPNEIYKIEQVGKKTDNKYDVYLYFNHQEGVTPATELKGVPDIDSNGKVAWISPFRFAVDLLDLALTNRNIMQVSISSVVFPFKIMMADECDFEDANSRCSHGRLMSLKAEDEGRSLGNCRACNGSGQKVPYSPLGQYLWRKPESASDQQNFPAKPVEFVEPPTQGLTFVREQVEIDTHSARQILHLHTSNSKTQGSENMTATGMAIEQSSQHSFIRGISDQIFDLWDWLNKRISFQRYDNYDQVPVLNYPQTFDFRTEGDIWEQIKLARESEAPPYVMHRLFVSLLSNMQAGNPKQVLKLKAISEADRLFGLSDMAIASRKASGSIEDWEVALHDSSLQMVNQLIRESDGSYLDLEIEEMVQQLRDYAKNNTFVRATTDAAVIAALGA